MMAKAQNELGMGTDARIYNRLNVDIVGMRGAPAVVPDRYS
jgi:hypothetical protein